MQDLQRGPKNLGGLENNGYVHYLDCGGGFTSIYIC